MPVINLSDCWPQGEDGTRKPLPKQEELLKMALNIDLKSPKYIRYCGGVGSGKSLSGCIVTLSWAVLYPGDYLICREFGTDLRDTTYKIFLEVCPKELIAEHRIADRIIRIKNAQGGTSNIYFRGLDEPDKLRSMTLNGVFVDEANQTTEESFVMLQGRLRGKYVRKMVYTTNASGRNWLWRFWVDKTCFKTDLARAQFYNIHAPSTENIHLPPGYVQSMLETYSEDRIRREVLADEDSFTGQVYTEFRRDTHVVKPFRIPDNWERYIRMDHGFRNPAAALFFAVSPEGEIYLYKEFYEKEWLIHEIVNGKKITAEDRPGIKRLAGFQGKDTPPYRFIDCKIDPSTKNRHGGDGTSDFDEYFRVWPKELPPLGFARNDVQVGIDRVKSYLKVDPKTKRPRLFIFEDCLNTLDEITAYKYPELRENQIERRSEPEKPMKVKDHAMDALRYMIIDMPDPTKLDEIKEKYKHACLERSLVNEIKKVHSPNPSDPFKDGI